MTTPSPGFEPGTKRLTVVRSTAELRRNEIRTESSVHHKIVCKRSSSQHEEPENSVSLSDNVRGFSSVFY